MKNAIVGDPVIDNTGSLSKFRWIDSSIHKAAISETAWNGCTRIDELKYRLWRSFSRIEYSLLCTVVEISASPIARCWRRSILTRPWFLLSVFVACETREIGWRFVVAQTRQLFIPGWNFWLTGEKLSRRETNRENGFPFTVHIRHRYYGSRIF